MGRLRYSALDATNRSRLAQVYGRRLAGQGGAAPLFFVPPNFRELRTGEVRRIPLLRTWVNKGKREGLGPLPPGKETIAST